MRLSRTTTSDTRNMILALTWGLWQYYEIVYSNGRYLTDSVIDRLEDAVHVALINYSALAAEFCETDPRYFCCKPKDHQLLHLVEVWVRTTKINPRYIANYKNENFVRLMKRMCKVCDKRALPDRVIEHFLLETGLNWAAIRDGLDLVGLITE